MLKELENPTVKRFQEDTKLPSDSVSLTKLDAKWVRNVCLEAGADDVGFIEIDRKEIADQRKDILTAFPRTKTIICLVHRINSDSVRTPARHITNIEFKYASHQLVTVTRKIRALLEQVGVRAISETGNFPMDMDAWPGKVWTVSLKPVAVAAGLGRMGLNRMILHPRLGVFINLSALLIDREVTSYDRPIDYNPCLNCKLCATSCPTGAIASDGHFSFPSCVTHNYREKLGGFSDWVEQIAQSKDARDYRKRVSDSETVSMWQSLSYGANSKCDYCMAVCPAGEEVVGQYKENKKGFVKEIVRPLQKKEEKVYVVPDSDAEAHVAQCFPHKKIRRVRNGLRPPSIEAFLRTLPLVFQRQKSKDLNVTYHFTFTGDEEIDATVVIANRSITVETGLIGQPDIHVTADTRTWIEFLAKEKNIVWALIRRKIRFKGPLSLLTAFGRCFP